MRVLIVLTAVLCAGEARADALQSQVLAAARAARADGYAFRRTITIERTPAEKGQAPRRVVVEQFDPRRPPAERWSLVSVDGRAPNAKELADARKAKRGPVPSYADIARWFGAPATRVDGPAGYVTYRFARLPKGAIKLGPIDASENVMAEALVNTAGPQPFVERVRLTTTKGFRVMLVASVQSMAITGRYRLLPDGRPVPADQASDTTGSLFGKTGRLRTATTFTDFRPVR